MAADLHIHSHHSDGRASPAEILEHAARLGLEAVAITDHGRQGVSGHGPVWNRPPRVRV